MKVKKKIVIPIVIVAVAGAGIFAASRLLAGTPTGIVVDTYPVARGELVNSVDVTGTVESGNSVGIYSTLSYPISSVAVEVGDRVQAGELLCTLDASDLESTIRQNEASLTSAQAKANHSLELAEKQYGIAEEDVADNYNSQLLTARKAVQDAEAAVLTAQNRLESAQQDYSDARQDVRDIQDDDYDYADDETYDSALTSAKRKRAQAEITLESAQLGVEDAVRDLEDAQVSLRAVEKQVSDTVGEARDNVTTNQLNTDFADQQIALERLRVELSDAVVTAPISGTVTAVYAEEGASSSAGGGLLFVIEDTEDLKVTTKIKEYDIALVEQEMPVEIRADGTGDDLYEGELSMIAPTTLKDASGNTVDTNSAEFEAEIRVTSESKLRIGMNARMKIIVERKPDVLSVPSESITYDADGNEVVYILERQENENGEVITAKMVPVKTGMENDFSCEIVDSDIKEGDEVITNPSGLTDGVLVTLMNLDTLTAEGA